MRQVCHRTDDRLVTRQGRQVTEAEFAAAPYDHVIDKTGFYEAIYRALHRTQCDVQMFSQPTLAHADFVATSESTRMQPVVNRHRAPAELGELRSNCIGIALEIRREQIFHGLLPVSLRRSPWGSRSECTPRPTHGECDNYAHSG